MLYYALYMNTIEGVFDLKLFGSSSGRRSTEPQHSVEDVAGAPVASLGKVITAAGSVLLMLSCAAALVSLTSRAALPRGAFPLVSGGAEFVISSENVPLSAEPIAFDPVEAVADDEPYVSTGPTAAQRELAAEILEGMTPTERLYQMFFVTPEGLTGLKRVYQAGKTTQRVLELKPVGGLLYTSQNVETDEMAAEMLKNTMEYSAIPLFLAADESISNAAALGFNATWEGLKGLTIHVNPKNLLASIAALEDDLHNGKILQEDIDDAVLRILLAKIEWGIIT